MEKKNNKKILGIIIAIIVILLIVAIVGGIFVFKNANSSTGTEWGDRYFEELARDSSKYSYTGYDSQGNEKEVTSDTYANSTNCKIQFIKYEENTVPSMFISFEKKGKNCLKEYTIQDDNIASVAYPSSLENEEQLSNSSNYELQYLYNIKSEQYNWYIKETDQNKEIHFSEIKGLPRETYDFKEEEMKIGQTAEDGTPVISKFEETFIVPEIDTSSIIEVGDIHNIKENELNEYVKTSVEEYKDKEALATEEIKTATQSKITELETKKEQIKVAQEEKAKKEAEEKAKAEEEARLKAEEEAKKKAEEEANSSLKAGSYTLKYGTYKCGYSDGQYLLTLNKDGTGHLKLINPELNFDIDGTYYYSDGTITFAKSGVTTRSFDVIGNNKLRARWDDGVWTIK